MVGQETMKTPPCRAGRGKDRGQQVQVPQVPAGTGSCPRVGATGLCSGHRPGAQLAPWEGRRYSSDHFSAR